MSKLHVMIWKNSSIAKNEVHGVVEIDVLDFEYLIIREFERQFKKKVSHAEFIGVVERNIICDDLKLFNLKQR